MGENGKQYNLVPGNWYNITVSTVEDNDQTIVVTWNGMWKDEKIECWEYKIVT